MGIIKITSQQNKQIKLLKQLQQKKERQQKGLFFVEGVRAVEEALPTGLLRSFFYSEKLLASPRGAQLLSQAQGAGLPIYECSQTLFSELTDTVSSQGVLAIVQKPRWDVRPHGLFLIADAIQDPGNMGTLLRTAAGAGVCGVFIAPGSVDPYNPKAVRSSMGAVLTLPHWFYDREAILGLMEKEQIPLIVADVAHAQPYYAVRYPLTMALVIGNEAHGVHPLFRKQAQTKVKIPLLGTAESLNAAVAAGILLYEILRQHRSL